MKSQLLMLAACLGLVLGLLGASTVVVLRERQAKVEALMTAHADSSAVDSEAADSSGPASMVEPDTASAPQNSASAEVNPGVDPELTAADPARAQHDSPKKPDVASAGEANPTASPPLRTEQLAKMFAGMQAREAARVLSEMDDADIETVLSLLEDRQASAILGSLPPERAAVITENVIRGERSF